MKISKIIMMLAIGAISTFVLIASSTSEKIETQPGFHFEAELVGTVIDSSTTEGIEGAEVTIENVEKSATTDEYGTFTIADLEPGTHTLKVNADGYQSAEKEVEVTEEGGTVEISLKTEEK